MTNLIAEDAESLVLAEVMIGRQVKAARDLLGMSQAELCAACGISRSTLVDIERETGDPRRSNLKAVEDYLRSRKIRFSEERGVIGLPPEDE